MSARDNVACQELVEIITEYLDGALSDPDRTAFESHIAGCAGCHAYLQQMRDTVRAVGQLDAGALTAHDRERLLALFGIWTRG